jgi:hypothetical protein
VTEPERHGTGWRLLPWPVKVLAVLVVAVVVLKVAGVDLGGIVGRLLSP